MTLVRLATPSDAASILSIYAPYIEHTSLTFETVTPSKEDFAERIRTYLNNWPWLVAEHDGIIIGYAYASRYRERTAYQWCTEVSVYIDEAFQQRKTGYALYNCLFEILRQQGFRNIYAVINLPNEKSVSFHESMGFTWFATFEQVGYKLGKWKNVGWWRKTVNEFGSEPQAPVPFKDLNKQFLKTLFEKNALLIRSS